MRGSGILTRVERVVDDEDGQRRAVDAGNGRHRLLTVKVRVAGRRGARVALVRRLGHERAMLKHGGVAAANEVDTVLEAKVNHDVRQLVQVHAVQAAHAVDLEDEHVAFRIMPDGGAGVPLGHEVVVRAPFLPVQPVLCCVLAVIYEVLVVAHEPDRTRHELMVVTHILRGDVAGHQVTIFGNAEGCGHLVAIMHLRLLHELAVAHDMAIRPARQPVEKAGASDNVALLANVKSPACLEASADIMELQKVFRFRRGLVDLDAARQHDGRWSRWGAVGSVGGVAAGRVFRGVARFSVVAAVGSGGG
mmetsp:Transcript_23163/g.72249  ORF Transcript_23163/g.72249 Transcript_23163/m.72249 type:complete len:305 (-) Transcript_23163:1644-2558(-)